MREIKVIIENGFASTPDSKEEDKKAINMFFEQEEYEKLISGISIPVKAVNVAIQRFATQYSHKLTVFAEITPEEAGELQFKAGYHPHGYGFYQFRVENGITTWVCSYSCD